MSDEKYSVEEIDAARNWLKGAHVFYPEHEDDEGPEERKKWAQAINLNDVWAWACSDCTFVEDEELPELARLVKLYGWCGALYFCYKKDDKGLPGFHDNARFVQFVEHEEELRNSVEDYDERAYHKLVYTLGEMTAGSVCTCEHFVNWHAKTKGKCAGSTKYVENKRIETPCETACQAFVLKRPEVAGKAGQALRSLF
jgi:hypothetical protein